jgi:hypothetical protein
MKMRFVLSFRSGLLLCQFAGLGLSACNSTASGTSTTGGTVGTNGGSSGTSDQSNSGGVSGRTNTSNSTSLGGTSAPNGVGGQTGLGGTKNTSTVGTTLPSTGGMASVAGSNGAGGANYGGASNVGGTVSGGASSTVQPAACPATEAEATNGAACPVVMGCAYGSDCCFCIPTACGGQPTTWTCNTISAPPPNCPASPPAAGTACVLGTLCNYCLSGGRYYASCTAGGWNVGYAQLLCN